MTIMYHLCKKCGDVEARGTTLKMFDLPYEEAKNHFGQQYWQSNPLYDTFEDVFPWQEDSLDMIFNDESRFQQLVQDGVENQDVRKLTDCIIGSALHLGYKTIELDGRDVGRFRVSKFAKEIV